MSEEPVDYNVGLIALAERIARRAHAGQFRRDGVTPYINHPLAVAAKLALEPPVVIATALLHDVLEDTSETVESLREAGILDSVIKAVVTLTKTKHTTCDEYLQTVACNEIARRVKIADMLHNLSDSPTERQIVKYAKGLLTLVQASKPATQREER